MRSHTLLSLFGYAALCLGGYSLVICLLCRFLAIGKRADEIRFQWDRGVGVFPKVEPKSVSQLEAGLTIGAHKQPGR